jgi:NADH:ubiquinone oxidoreductase subunit 3 (subunit A)
VAFALILGATSLLCVLGNRLAPKTQKREVARIQYSCGEEPFGIRQRIQASLYRYLVYFLVVDSSLLIVAFGVPDFAVVNPLPLILYLVLLLVSVLLFVDGSER